MPALCGVRAIRSQWTLSWARAAVWPLVPMIQPMTSLRFVCVERRLGEIGAVEERHDAVADVEDVVHAVADQDDADAVVLEAA